MENFSGQVQLAKAQLVADSVPQIRVGGLVGSRDRGFTAGQPALAKAVHYLFSGQDLDLFGIARVLNCYLRIDIKIAPAETRDQQGQRAFHLFASVLL